jgi:hypothetical protein
MIEADEERRIFVLMDWSAFMYDMVLEYFTAITSLEI